MTTGETTPAHAKVGSAWRETALASAPLAALAVTFARCIRPPDAFSATQALFTCEVAPKRCGFGQAMAWLHIPAGHFAVYSVLSAMLLLAAIVTLSFVAVRSGLTRSRAGVVILASLAASFGFGVFVALNGSLDVPMVILTASGFLARRRLQAPAIAVCAVLGVMVHEAYLVVFLPVAMLPVFLRVERPRDLIAPLAIGGAVVPLTIVLALKRPLEPAQAERAFQLLQVKADFPLQGYGLEVLRRSLADNLAMMHQLAQTPWLWSLEFANAALLIPVAGLFVTLVCAGWRAPWPAKLLSIGAAFAPLAMNVLGYDVLRWGGLCILTMGLSLCALAARYGPPRLSSPLFPGVAAMVAVILLSCQLPIRTKPARRRRCRQSCSGPRPRLG